MKKVIRVIIIIILNIYNEKYSILIVLHVDFFGRRKRISCISKEFGTLAIMYKNGEFCTLFCVVT